MYMSHVILNERLYPFTVHIFNIHGSGVLTGSALLLFHGWCHVKCCRLGGKFCVHHSTIPSLQCHFIQSHIGRVYVCLAVTCCLHFWQNDWDLFCATAVTQGWNGYRNKSWHRKLTLEKKFFCHSCRDSNPGPFCHESNTLNH